MADKEKEKQKDQANRLKALDLALSQIEKQFGKGSIMRLGRDTPMDIAFISTGALTVDMALGIGGVPRGRVTEIYGPESSGKTTLCTSILVEAQRAGGIAAFVDAEHALDPAFAKLLGIDLDELLVSQPDTGEQALEITEQLVRSNAVDAIVIDSVAALVPRAEIEGEMGDQFIGLQARLMSQALRKLTSAIARSKTSVIFINQIREKIGVMFGSPEVTPGGRALKFYSSVRIDLRRIETIKVGDRMIGSRIRAKIVKNKVAAPFRQAEFEIIFDEGISKIGAIMDVADQFGIISRQGSWWSYGEIKLGQGRESARSFLRENPKMLKEIEKQARLQASPKKAKNAEPAEATESVKVTESAKA